MVGLHYRKDREVWEVDIPKRGVQSRRRRQFHSKTTAQEFRRKMEDLIERERAGMDFIEPITFKDFSDLFVQNHFKEKAKRYKATCKGKIKNLFIPAFGDKEMTEITFDEIVSWRDKRESRVAPKTLIEDIALLQLMFTAAIKNGYAEKNPVVDVEAPKNIPKKKRQAVQDSILRQGLRQMSGIDLLIILALRNSGAREAELLRIEFEDLDFENRLIRVKSVEGGTTKNYETRHTIMTPTFVAIVNLLGVKEGPLFRVPYKTFQNRFCRTKKKFGFSWDAHSLRHSFNTYLRAANIPEKVVAHYMGHTSKKSMTDHYTSLLPEFVTAAIKAADFGEEFLSRGLQNVVTMRPPRFENPINFNGLNVAGAGFEPDTANKINGLASSSKNKQNQRVWRKT